MILPEKGKFLIADPFLLDNYFSRSVVFVCEHENDLGTVGFMINRSLPDKLEDFFPELKDTHIPVYYGGPVHPDRLHFLHTLPNQISGGLEVADGIFWGGDFNTAKILLEENLIDLDGIKFFLGYSGWEGKQLQNEMKESTWIVGDSSKHLMFVEKEENIWRQSLICMGGDFAQMSNYPIHPSLN